MLYISEKDSEKLALIDRIFSNVSVEYLQEIAESEEIVSKLKGESRIQGPVQILVTENIQMSSAITRLDAELSGLRMDMQLLLRSLNAQIFAIPYNQDFASLKNKHGIY